MKIALLGPHFAEYTAELACALAVENEVMLVLHKENAAHELGSRLHSLARPGLDVKFLRKSPSNKHPLTLLNMLRVAAWLWRYRPDVIHYQESLNLSFTIPLVILFRNTPFVLTIHDHIQHSGDVSADRKIVGFHQRVLRKCADVAIVHGQRLRTETVTLFPWLSDRTVSIPHGPLGQLVSSPSDRWDVGVLLFFGRVEEYKGLRYLLDAMSILRKKGISVRLVIAGRGPELERLRGDINANSDIELVERFVAPDKVQAVFERANIVVLPYTDATQSGVAAMALRFSRAVIASNVGSIGEMVRDGFNGTLVPPKDARALADAIAGLVKDQSLCKRYSINARQLAENDLSWAEIGKQTADAYKKAINKA